MLLAIDIGNTNITFGIFQGSKIIKRFDIPTKRVIHSRRGRFPATLFSSKRDPARYYTGWRENVQNIDAAVICSVVPAATKILGRDLKGALGIKPYYIGKDIRVPIKNLYRKPAQVGQDRLVNAFAGVKIYGAPLVIVDFGTAITFDIISKNKEYMGGMILPGLNISLEALNQRTALLPKIKLARPKEFIGRDTKNSMLSGIIYGFAALTDDLVMRIKDKIGRDAKVIGTGGNINLMGKFCRKINKIDPDLTLKGLTALYGYA